jgi:hypothetical protein
MVGRPMRALRAAATELARLGVGEVVVAFEAARAGRLCNGVSVGMFADAFA